LKRAIIAQIDNLTIIYKIKVKATVNWVITVKLVVKLNMGKKLINKN